ncbi:MAG: PAS domain S-box protein [Nitrospirae bacterium]|nr:PAS domain S-box protein [Nitrospirota bacterium]
MFSRILGKMTSINPWHFLWIIILVAEGLTLALNSLQSVLRWGHISRELIEIGSIDALIVSLIAAPIVIYSLNAHNEKLKRNIASQADLEKALKRSEQDLRLLFDSSADGIFILDMQGHFIDVNKTAHERLGYTKEEMLAMKISELDPPEFASMVPERLARIKEAGQAIFESAHLRKDGSIMPVEVNSRILEYKGVNVYFSVIRDISSRRQAEEATERLIKAVSVVADGIAITDDRDRFIYVNEAHARIYGLRQDELIGKSWRDTVAPELVPLIEKQLSGTLHNRETGMWSGEFPVLRKDGVIIPTEITATARWDDMGNYLGHICIIRDISERKETERKLRESEQFIRNILDTVDEGFIVIDRELRILTANNAYCKQVGRSSDEVIGSHCYEISHKMSCPCRDEAEVCAVRNVFQTGEPYTAFHKHPGGGGAIYVETRAFPLKDSSGTVTSVIETVLNITEKHLLEEEQLKTQKLEAIGTLAGGIAHDFNNLLQGVFGYISMAKISLDRKEPALTMLEQAEQALHMSVNLTSQLLTFSKGGKPVKKKIALQPVIENAVRFALSGSSADFRIKIEEDLWVVDADDGQIAQVVQNIVLNADQAMPSGGTILVAAKNVVSPGTGLPHLPAEGRYVEISIRDNGGGIAADNLKKIFDPYFTTKEKGSGLGLATSCSIVKNHGGIIDVISEPGKGSTFSIYLPATGDAPESGGPSARSSEARKGKVLVMDDEELIRNIAAALVKILGHDVEIAENGEAAIEKYEAALRSGSPIDVVVLDLTVRGGLGGRDTLERLVSIDPGVKAIVSSGYSGDAIISDYAAYGFKARLTKPYQLEELRDTLNALLSI